MTSQLVITALGEDRPGIVDALTQSLLDLDLNIEDSRMSVLGGEFAILLLVSGDDAAIAAADNRHAELEQKLGMQLLCKRTRAGKTVSPAAHYDIEVVAIDNPGIVHQLASFFSGREINIEDLATARYAAAHTATPMFAVNMKVSIPEGTDIEAVREEFLAQCEEMNLDASFTEAEAGRDEKG